jgi:hypothetical protein
MTNPFQTIDDRLSNIECLLLDIKHKPKQQDKNKYSEEYMKLAFETGRNFQLTGENNFNELIYQLKLKQNEKHTRITNR